MNDWSEKELRNTNKEVRGDGNTMKEGRKEGRREGRREGRKEERKE